jgi:hypothetical protein
MKAYHFINQQLSTIENKWSNDKGEFFTSKRKCFERINDIFSYYDKEQQTFIKNDEFMENWPDVILSFEYQWTVNCQWDKTNNGKKVLQRITIREIEIQ